MEKRDYYEVLGVSRDAGRDEIKRAYRGLARKFHPDVNKDTSASDRFKEATEAYEVLSDQNNRATYDRYGHAGLGNNGGFSSSFTGSSMADIFEEFFGGFGGRSRGRQGPRRGADMRFDLNISFEDSVFGTKKEIELDRPGPCDRCNASGAEPGTSPTTCPTCNGTGEHKRIRQSVLGSFVNVTTCPTCRGSGNVISSPCTKCNGSKQISVHRSLNVSIPAGISDGQQIRLSGEGAPGSHGGPAGNLYVFISVSLHKFFKRRGDDVVVELRLNMAQAALGDEVSAPTVDGDQILKIPRGTHSGTVIRMKARGIPRLNSTGRGDQLVIVQVETPRNLSDDQVELFTKLNSTLGREQIVPQQDRNLLETLKDALGDILGI